MDMLSWVICPFGSVLMQSVNSVVKQVLLSCVRGAKWSVGWVAARSALHCVSPRSLRRKFTTERQPLLLATSHRSLLAASHSLHKKYTFLLLCHLGNLLTMNTRAFLLIFYVVRVFMRLRPSGALLSPIGQFVLCPLQIRGSLNCYTNWS